MDDLVARVGESEGMSTNTALPIVVGVIVLGYIFYRQLTERPIKDNPLKLPAVSYTHLTLPTM